MTAPADRDALIEVMAGCKQIDPWFGEEVLLPKAAAETILTAIEAAGCAVVPVEATDEQLATPIYDGSKKAIYGLQVTHGPYRRTET